VTENVSTYQFKMVNINKTKYFDERKLDTQRVDSYQTQICARRLWLYSELRLEIILCFYLDHAVTELSGQFLFYPITPSSPAFPCNAHLWSTKLLHTYCIVIGSSIDNRSLLLTNIQHYSSVQLPALKAHTKQYLSEQSFYSSFTIPCVFQQSA
jgi:hypothetical protein